MPCVGGAVPSPVVGASPSPIGVSPPGVVPSPGVVPACAIPPAVVVPGVVEVGPVEVAWQADGPTIVVDVPRFSYVADVPVVGAADYNSRGRAEADDELGTAVVVELFVGFVLHFVGVVGGCSCCGGCAAPPVVFIDVSLGYYAGGCVVVFVVVGVFVGGGLADVARGDVVDVALCYGSCCCGEEEGE